MVRAVSLIILWHPVMSTLAQFCYSSGPRKDARPRLFHKLELCLSAGALGVKGHTFYRIKNSFWKVEGAGFETGFSVPKARALPTHQSYADSDQERL